MSNAEGGEGGVRDLADVRKLVGLPFITPMFCGLSLWVMHAYKYISCRAYNMCHRI